MARRLLVSSARWRFCPCKNLPSPASSKAGYRPAVLGSRQPGLRGHTTPWGHLPGRGAGAAAAGTCRGFSEWRYADSLRPELDMENLCRDVTEIADNIRHRKGDGDVHKVVDLWKELKALERELADLRELASQDAGDAARLAEELRLLEARVEEREEAFYQSASMLPNRTHPETPWNEEDEPRLVSQVGQKPTFTFPVKSHVELGESLDIIRLKNLGHVTGHRSYFLKGAAAMLEHALVRYTTERLLARGFRAVAVPDLMQPLIFEGCGMRTKGLHTQVYKLDSRKHKGNLCLSGTAEVGLAGYFLDRELSPEDLPQRLFATSQCFRAETTHSAEARGLYRVHQFTKVEMFCVTTQDQSDSVFGELVAVQKDLFSELGLHFQNDLQEECRCRMNITSNGDGYIHPAMASGLLDMPSHDLGAPAYRKYDIEAWMPARQSYGEISSASNCTDFQSRRLRIKYRTADGNLRYVHTLNGTACAVPRLLLALLETNQQRDGSVLIPEALWPYMNGRRVITKATRGLLHHTRL